MAEREPVVVAKSVVVLRLPGLAVVGCGEGSLVDVNVGGWLLQLREGDIVFRVSEGGLVVAKADVQMRDRNFDIKDEHFAPVSVALNMTVPELL